MSSSQLTHIFRGRYTTNQYWYTLFWMVNNHKYPSIPSVNAWGSHLPSRSSMPRGARPPVTWWTHGDDMTGRCCVKIEHLIIPVFLLELPPIGAHPPFFHKPSSYEEPFFSKIISHWHVFTCFPYLCEVSGFGIFNFLCCKPAGFATLGEKAWRCVGRGSLLVVYIPSGKLT